MSASMLRDAMRIKLRSDIEEWTEALENSTKTADDLRVAQGVVKGLKIAGERLAEAYQEMHS
jgi:hypothetical protein